MILKYKMLAGCVTSPSSIFPKYFPPLVEDLVNRMVEKRLNRRADIGEVARHPWLSDYAHVVSDVIKDSRDCSKILLNLNATEPGSLKSRRIATRIAATRNRERKHC